MAFVPVVVGVGDVKNASLDPKDAIEPLELMLQAIHNAGNDSKLSKAKIKELLLQTDSLAVVDTWTWPYRDLPGTLASKIGVKPKYTHYTDRGGNQPAKIFDEAARQISKGESCVAIVTGGEALASLDAYMKEYGEPPKSWTPAADEVKSVFTPSARSLKSNLGAQHSIGFPIQVYPLYENSFRAHRNQSIEENHRESAMLYGNFASIAAKNPMSWNYNKPPQTTDTIAKVTKKNRIIDFPYPLLMNAFNSVNCSAACILTSTENAEKLGVPKSQWIYPRGGAGIAESNDFWNRAQFHHSSSIARSIDAALKASGLSKMDIDVYDFYSCFPIVPKLACHHLGLSITNPEKPISLLGGLTSFGGAGNNYSMHALVDMVRFLRERRGKNGLVLANGGVATYQYAVCVSTSPADTAFPSKNPLPSIIKDEPIPSIERNPEGRAQIETYTVDFSRDGSPSLGHVVGRLSSGQRFLANHGDDYTLEELASWSREPIGRRGRVKKGEDDRNIFVLDESPQASL